ncbi:hypothetical protein [Faecalibacillus faecis]|mgnify:CR=1 FL=1|uniref:hypothetical protein n=1 Tax=Faecalibacillus faecis TaxID=1982628 RepID=UPI003AB71C34
MWKRFTNEKAKKRNVKLFEITHIYLNRPTKQQYEDLKGLEDWVTILNRLIIR